MRRRSPIKRRVACAFEFVPTRQRQVYLHSERRSTAPSELENNLVYRKSPVKPPAVSSGEKLSRLDERSAPFSRVCTFIRRPRRPAVGALFYRERVTTCRGYVKRSPHANLGWNPSSPLFRESRDAFRNSGCSNVSSGSTTVSDGMEYEACFPVRPRENGSGIQEHLHVASGFLRLFGTLAAPAQTATGWLHNSSRLK